MSSRLTYEERLERVLTTRDEARRDLWSLIDEVKADETMSAERRDDLLRHLYGSLGPSDVRENFLWDLKEYDIGVSLTAQMVHLIHRKNRLAALGLRIGPGGNPKDKDRAFARALGVPTPDVVSTASRFEQIELVPRTIIKPAQGHASMGVFFVNDDRTLLSLKTRAVYSRLSDALVEVEKYAARVSADEWVVETAVVNEQARPANDLKAFAFYGEVGFVLEVAHGTGPNGRDMFCYYDQSGSPFDPGRRGIRHFVGSGVPDEALEKARIISAATPLPFLRVDLLRGVEASHLGEITANPGGSHAGNIYPEYDRQYGAMFVDAEARLMADLLRGKRFTVYFETYFGRSHA